MKIGVGKICLLLFFLSLVLSNGAAQTNAKDDLPRGSVIEKVVCEKDASQSYALYLPSNYTPDKKWAILYIFDPFARGKVPVEIFREAAEKFGFVVVGSNNSQNNTGAEKLSQIIEAFWADSHSRFSVDEKRVYAAGLSGGARVASYFAASCRGCAAGIIVSGATFPPKFPLEKPLAFSVFGTVGANDFNYPELVKTFAKLNETGTANYLAVFDGQHQWLPKDLAFDALRWMNWQAMKSGRMETDKNFIADLYAEQISRARTLAQKGDVLQTARIYENVVSDFKEAADTKSAAEMLAEIRREKSYKRLADEERAAFDEQDRTARKIIAAGAELLDKNTKNAVYKQVSDEIERWREKSKAADDSTERRLARRILGEIFVETYEAALYRNAPQKDYKTMIANLELTRLVSPQSLDSSFELARAFALDGQKKNALDALAQAVKVGFKDCARIAGKDEWAILRGDSQFQKIIEQMKCSEKNI